MTLLLLLIITQFALWSFVFNFQRITLKLAKRIASHTNLDVNQCQIALTPNWIGLLGWLNRLLSPLVIGFIFIHYGLLYSFALFAFIYLGGYAILSTPVEGLILGLSMRFMRQSLSELKKSSAGYIVAIKIEKVFKKDSSD